MMSRALADSEQRDERSYVESIGKMARLGSRRTSDEWRTSFHIIYATLHASIRMFLLHQKALGSL
jgi:hypothetical protein